MAAPRSRFPPGHGACTYHAYHAYHAPFPSACSRHGCPWSPLPPGHGACTYHAYHAYHAPFPSAMLSPRLPLVSIAARPRSLYLPRIPRISRAISVGHALATAAPGLHCRQAKEPVLTTHTTHITRHFRRPCSRHGCPWSPLPPGQGACTYHAYHAYHAPFPSAVLSPWLPPVSIAARPRSLYLPRIPRISRTISVGLALSPWLPPVSIAARPWSLYLPRIPRISRTISV